MLKSSTDTSCVTQKKHSETAKKLISDSSVAATTETQTKRERRLTGGDGAGERLPRGER